MTENDSPQLSADELALILAFRAGDYSKVAKVATQRQEQREAAQSQATRAAIKDMMDASERGDAAAVAEAMAAMHAANPPTAEQAEKKARQDAIHSAWIHAESAYSLPLIERVALFMIGRLVLQGYFTRYIFFDNFENMVKDYASYMQEGLLYLNETPDLFFRDLKNYGKE